MKLSALTGFVFCLNAAIDTGKYQDISIEEVEKHITKGDLLRYLTTTLKDNIDLSLITPVENYNLEDAEIGMQVAQSKLGAKVEAEIIKGLQNILQSYGGDERRKWGIENSGLCLIVAWVTELIQMEEWD
jgi:hypothetical protein